VIKQMKSRLFRTLCCFAAIGQIGFSADQTDGTSLSSSTQCQRPADSEKVSLKVFQFLSEATLVIEANMSGWTGASLRKLSRIYKNIPRQSLRDMDVLAEVLKGKTADTSDGFRVAYEILLMRDFESDDTGVLLSGHFSVPLTKKMKSQTFSQISRSVWNGDGKTLNLACWAPGVYDNVIPTVLSERWPWNRKFLKPRRSFSLDSVNAKP
jgi:hypothetical protein